MWMCGLLYKHEPCCTGHKNTQRVWLKITEACHSRRLTTVGLIWIVSAVVHTITALATPETYAIIPTTEISSGWALEVSWIIERKFTIWACHVLMLFFYSSPTKHCKCIVNICQGRWSFLLQFNCVCVRVLTAFLRVLIRVISTVILPITLPGQRLTQSVITLELIMGAVPCHWKRAKKKTSKSEIHEIVF